MTERVPSYSGSRAYRGGKVDHRHPARTRAACVGSQSIQLGRRRRTPWAKQRPGFSLDDRHENVRRIAEVARILLLADTSAIVSAISPSPKSGHSPFIVPEGHFIEVFVDAPLEVAEARDTKGLYQRARNGELADFTALIRPTRPRRRPKCTWRRRC